MADQLTVQQARSHLANALASYGRAVRYAFPIGCLVLCEVGRASFRAEVVDHGPGWSYHGADRLRVRNLATEKIRWVSAEDCFCLSKRRAKARR